MSSIHHYKKPYMESGAMKFRRKYINKKRTYPYPNRYTHAMSLYKFPRFQTDDPKTKMVTLRACKIVTFGTAIADWNSNPISVNDCYDPFNDTHATQPAGFKDLLEHYTHYTVVAAKFKMMLCSATSVDNALSFLVPGENSGNPLKAYTAGGLTGLLAMHGRTPTLLHASWPAERDRCLYMYLDIAKFCGKSRKDIIGIAEYKGNLAASPSELVTIDHVMINPYATSITSRSFVYELVQYVVLSEPKWFDPKVV